MPRLLAFLALLALACPPARAATEISCLDANNQPQTVSPTNPCPVTVAGGSATPTGAAGAPNAAVVSVQGVAGGTPQPVTVLPATGTPNETTVTCGVASAPLLAAASATQFVVIRNATGGGMAWINVAGAAAVAAPPSIDIAGGTQQTWSPLNGFVPTSAINCIAPVAQAITVLWK